jgi:hypothetical protein
MQNNFEQVGHMSVIGDHSADCSALPLRNNTDSQFGRKTMRIVSLSLIYTVRRIISPHMSATQLAWSQQTLHLCIKDHYPVKIFRSVALSSFSCFKQFFPRKSYISAFQSLEHAFTSNSHTNSTLFQLFTIKDKIPNKGLKSCTSICNLKRKSKIMRTF